VNIAIVNPRNKVFVRPMSRATETNRTHFGFGRQMLGRPRELPRPIGQSLFTPFLGGLSVRSEANQAADGMKKIDRYLSMSRL